MAGAALAMAQNPLPHLEKVNGVTQMVVDGKPFLMLSGELHNSTGGSAHYMDPIWKRMAQKHLNTVIGSISWELLEPEEGKFDYSLVDAHLVWQLEKCRVYLCSRLGKERPQAFPAC